MEDAQPQENSQACSCCHTSSNEEVADCCPCECQSTKHWCLCPGTEKPHPWEQVEEHAADQHSQQAVSPESPADHSNDNQTESYLNCKEEAPPLQSSPGHAVSQQGTTNHTHFHSADVHHRTQRQIPEPCWYCMKSLTTDMLKKLQLDFESLGLPPKGKRFSYQQDPRPHFGVAHSPRSTPLPLWGSEGPQRRDRRGADGDQMSACPHCHLALPLDTLQWHEAKCLVFEGLKPPCGKAAK